MEKLETVLGVELSEGMLQTARYKFHQWSGEQLLEQVTDEILLKYWQEFRAESEQYKDQVTFVLGDFQEIGTIKPESMDSAVGHQFMHWTDLSKSFKQLYRFLKTRGEVLWNSASHFYEDSQFPSAEYGFRYNDFVENGVRHLLQKSSYGNKINRRKSQLRGGGVSYEY